MRAMFRTVLAVLALVFLSCQARAQLDLRMMLDPSMLKFFDPKSAFSANAEFTTQEGRESTVWPVKIAILGNLTRLEMDITKERGPRSSDEGTAAYFKDMRTAGSAESVSIFNPDEKCSFLILPRLKVYVQTPLPEKAMEEMKQRPKAAKVELGKEKIDGRLCTKYTIRFDPEKPMDVWRTWESTSATIWMAEDVPACPLRIDILDSTGNTNSTFVTKGVEATKVDKKLFEPPKGFTKCESMDALMKTIMEHWPKDRAP
jgi:hypothetical protein